MNITNPPLFSININRAKRSLNTLTICLTMVPAISGNSNSLNILDFVVNKGHGVKGLADLGLKTLPHQYIQPPQERFDTSLEDATHDSIPLIDMSRCDDPKVAEAVCNAAQKWGFFQIINHGVPIHVLENVKEATHGFFGLPAEEKNKYSKEHSVTNNVRYGTSFTPEAEKALEWKDYLSLFYVSDDEAASCWPPICRNEALEYMKSFEIVVKKLLEILMNGLNVKEIDQTKESILMGSKRINLNYYPICPNPELTVGVGRHSDVSTLTLLLQDDIGGLYVRNTMNMKWIHVRPISGALVINVGDALQIMSNGKYKSVEHRVSANGSRNRISAPIFVNPKASDIIGPLPEVLQSGEKPLYKHVLYSDYVKHFFRKAHDGKATIEFAKA
ncbi:putative oxoglutarate/iron-dependent dioxygenase, non-heme dioxygenase domain-containing protein [Helianthus annuus]|nr:putative oxoglutarate/iron-dependent dioxygenase, non-heme dioxygenase domain-containing protein [Helianthus annuus]